MKLKLCFLLLSAVIIGLTLHLSSVFIETAENEAHSEISDKEDLAKRIFFEIRHVDNPTEKAELYRKAADECSETEFAQEALWRLSQLYINDFDEPNVKEAIDCLEYFIKTYPESEWRSHVEFSLFGLYEKEGLWSKAVALCEKLMAENPDMPSGLKEELSRRYNAAKAK